MICASFDIGKKNFSFYIEEFTNTSTEHINFKTIYEEDGTLSDTHHTLLNNIYQNGTKLVLENTDLTTDCDPSLKLDPKLFKNMTKLLDTFHEYWEICDVFIIEQQMLFGKMTNPMAVKLGQHCYSYFSIKYGDDKRIIEYPAYNKTQVLGAAKIATGQTTKLGKNKYKSMTKPQRKKWCISEAINVLNTRGDTDTIEQIRKSKKKDDLCDVICQLQSWKWMQLNGEFK